MTTTEKDKYIEGSERKNYFIFAGRIDEIKGIKKLLVAWKLLFEIDENIPQLFICGTGPEEQWCKDFIKSNNLFSKVKLMGFMDNQKVVELISESLAIILPTQWYEGFPMSIVEAYGYGTPVLGSSIGNVGSLVIDGVTGYTFNHDSEKAIVSTVQKFLKAYDNEVDLYKNTVKNYNKRYTEDKNYRILSEIYKKCRQY